MVQDTEDEEVLLATLLGNLNVGTVHGADDQGAVHLELHVGCPRSLSSGSGDVLAQLSGWNQRLGPGHVVVRNEDQLQVVLGVRVVVDLLTDTVCQAHNPLRHVVGRRSLSANDAAAGRHLSPLLWRHLLQLVPAENDGHDVHELALVLMNALDLNIKHGVGVQLNTSGGLDLCSQVLLVGMLHVLPLLVEVLIIGMSPETLQQGHVVDPLVSA
mmetsp:Transcript_40500/g.114719  ORF Transcript_40500/g.114719 Transcript_40500/m.114719 type:complete len:214 (+) Transcript_40500:475-1116(+)